MTALAAYERLGMETEIEIPENISDYVSSLDLTMNLKPGEVITSGDLIKTIIIQGANDAAIVLALESCGSSEKFVALMNEKARELGALKSNFTNPHGLHDSDHYTTAYDLALISAAAMDNDIFREIVGTRKVAGISNEKFNYDRVFFNKNKMLSMYEGGNGIKTGYTVRAGRCLVSSSIRNGMEVICVVLNHPDMWNDSIALMNYAHANYKMTKVLEAGYKIENIYVEAGEKDNTSFVCPAEYTYPIRENEIKNIDIKAEYDSVIRAPVAPGKVSGKLKVYYDNQLLFVSELYTIENIAKKSILDLDYWSIK